MSSHSQPFKTKAAPVPLLRPSPPAETEAKTKATAAVQGSPLPAETEAKTKKATTALM